MPAGYRDHLARSRAPSPLAVGRYLLWTDQLLGLKHVVSDIANLATIGSLWHRQPRSMVLVKL